MRITKICIIRFPMVVHHVASDLSLAGGPTYTVPALCSVLGEQGAKVVLHALAPSTVATGGTYEFYSHPRTRLIYKLGISESMRKALVAAAQEADIIHSHLLWMMPTIYPAYVMRAKANRCHLMMSPRGTLDPWDFHNHVFQKRIAWTLGQRMNLSYSSCLHATAPMECEHFRALGFRAPVAIIPNGVDIPDLSRFPLREKKERQLLFLARINPKKGIDLLLKAWRNVQDRASDWKLQIAGSPNGDHLPEMQALATQLGVQRVQFLSPITEEQKWDLYRNAELYVLPTRGDNWAVSISDALSFGVPAIVTKEAPWEGLQTYSCGWWIDLSVDALTETLREALREDSGKLQQMGRRGREWMAREFSWQAVGRMMNTTYEWVVNGGAKPEWVEV
jgi:glycosyltransferase involved in cell wall biosynthesis